MNFEVKKIDVLGNIKTKDANNSYLMLSVVVGVVGCPYADIVANKIVEYDFPNTSSISDVMSGKETFAANWVKTKYPDI
jgi:hypothetical protein